MSFIAVQPASTQEDTVSNGAFWPSVDLNTLRKTVRLDGTVTTERLKHALVSAIIQVNRDLKIWREKQQDDGYAMLDQVPAERIDDNSELVLLYLRAVYCLTRANLLERYADFDSTGKGTKDTAEQNQTITDLYRDARFAIRDILGESHVTVDLI